MNALRIAIVSPFPPLKGGIARFSSELAASLRACGGAELTLVGFRSLYPRMMLPEAVDPTLSRQPADALFAGGLVLYNPLTWLRTALALRKLRPDVLLLAHWAGFLLPLWWCLRKMSGVPSVLLLHNLASHDPVPFEPLLLGHLAAVADGAVTLSEPVASEASLLLPDARVLRLFHPEYPPEAPPPERDAARAALGMGGAQGPLLLFFGYVRPYKGLDLLLEAMPAILERMPEARLLVAGEFLEGEDQYLALAGRLGVAGSIEFRSGYQPSARVPLLFGAADLLVLPYRRATQSGVVSLAAGYGLPAVVTPVGSLGEAVGAGVGGRVAREVSPQAIAAAVLDALEGRGAGSGERGHTPHTGHSWEAFARALVAFLGEWRRAA